MHLEEISLNEFQEYVKHYSASNHYQSISYALLMAEENYDYEIVGLKTDHDSLVAASLILIKKIDLFTKYAYAPKGFLIDYGNPSLLKAFTEELKVYLNKKNIVFLKINPELAIFEIDYKNHKKKQTSNMIVKETLSNLGYVKLKDNLYFESILPRFNAIVNLKKFNITNLEKNTRNKIKRSEKKGLQFEKVNEDGLPILFDFIKKKRKKSKYYYNNYYHIFKKENAIDLFLVSVNAISYLEQAQESYNLELEKNAKLIHDVMQNPTEYNINLKMESDRQLLSYKNDILEATKRCQDEKKLYIAGALVIKHKNRIQILMSGYDTAHKRFNANYYLHYKILEYYKDQYDFADLNGLTGDFSLNNPYKGLNEFKLGFKPKVYEFIGEWDLVIKNNKYKKLLSNGTLAKIFNKTDIKKIEE